MTEEVELYKKFIPHAKHWDCYNDVPLKEDHTQKCVEIAENYSELKTLELREENKQLKTDVYLLGVLKETQSNKINELKSRLDIAVKALEEVRSISIGGNGFLTDKCYFVVDKALSQIKPKTDE